MAVAEVPGPSRGDGRVPPYNLEAEESLLGAMLLSKDAIVAASEIGVTAGDFYKPVHGHIFDAITSLYGAGEPADPVTVAEELRRAGLLAEIGGPGLLVSLQVRTPATSSAARYARIVGELALLRRLIAVAGEIAEMGYRVPEDVAEAVDRAEAMVFDVAQHRVSDSMAPIRDLLDDSLTRLEMLYEKADAITGIPTGYRRLDELLSGLQPSSLVIVGARPATGKCLTGDTLLTDPRTGARRTLAEVYRQGQAGAPVEVISLGEVDRRLHVRRPSAFVDDGIRPVFRVRTRLGREVRTTAAHPFLTRSGWRPLADIAVGTSVAVPRVLPVFGREPLPDAEVVLLAHLLGDSTQGATTLRFSTGSSPVMADLAGHARPLGIECVPERGEAGTATCRVRPEPSHPDALVELLARFGLLGLRAHQRRVPDAVFRLPRRQLALFLNRVLGDAGSPWWSPRQGGSACITYCSLSAALVADVAHLLLRFGINARVRRRVIHRQGWRGPAHELEVTSASEIRVLAEEIGMFSKEAALDNLLRRIDLQQLDQPGRAPELVGASAGGVAAVRSLPGPRRAEVVAGSDDAAPALAWDEVVSIDAAGEERVYDLTVPGDHNFVAGDMFVHNTAFALGLAAHAALEANRPVLFFSLEMSHLEITQRILSSEARVDSSRMRNGKLAEADWAKISHAIGRLAEAPLYIDDNPRATVLEIRAKSRRLKSRLGDLGVVVVDYLQLMTGRDRAENRQVEVSEISRGLKVLARELQTPVVALSQLSRGLELRADKRPMLADLRESGCMPASTRLMRADTGEEVSLGELVLSQDQPLVWSLDKHLRLVPSQLTKAFRSGIKPVFRLRLASGREVDATSNHPFLTVEGWSPVEELTAGSFIAVPRRIPAPTAGVDGWNDDDLVLLARATTKFIPESIFGLGDDKLALFLRHLWATDGSITIGRNQQGALVRTYYATNSGRLAQGVQRALLRFEIGSRIFPTRKSGYAETWHVVIRGAPDQLRFLSHVGCHGARGEVVPKATEILQTGSQRLLDPSTSDVTLDEVIEVVALGDQPTFDATVATTHNFIANGVVAHNSLEQDADVVMFLYRDELYNPESPDRGTAEVLVAKHRSGPTGMDRLAFLDHYTRFANMAKDI